MPEIPNAVIGAVADVLGMHYYSHSKLNALFMEAGAPGDIPTGNCVEKCRAWLKRTNTETPDHAYEILGRIVENFMDWPHNSEEQKKRINDSLARSGLTYRPGGLIFGTSEAIPASSLADIIHRKNIPALKADFERAVSNVDTDPSAAVTAASSILESIFRIYIEENALQMPSKEVIGALWGTVQRDLELNPRPEQRDDLRKICSGLNSLVDGIGALRTHGGTAHGHGLSDDSIRPAEARLAVHAAFGLAVFVFEKWPPK